MGNAARTLLSLPLELRLIIFKCHFQSVTISHGFGKAHSNHTSILSTCRLVYHDALPLLAPNVSIRFRSTAVMLDCLTTLSPALIRGIRYLRVKAYPFPVTAPADAYCYTTYLFSTTLSLFPGLQLDLLVVEDCYHDEDVNDGWGDMGTYDEIQGLLGSDGWKELHFITPTTEFIISPNDHTKSRHPQPSDWNERLLIRDGKGSGASVTMYVANDANLPGATDDPDRRTLTAVPGHLEISEQAARNNAPIVDENSYGDFIDQREVLVVVKRGKDAVYVQDGSKLNTVLRELFLKMTWREIRESGLWRGNEEDPCSQL